MKSLGYVHTPTADHHRWSPYSQRSISTGKGTFSRTTRLMLHQMRWRKPPRQYGLMVVAWVLSILVHLVAAAGMLLVRTPQAHEPPPEGQANAIQVRFIDAHPAPPPPPPVAPRPVETPPRRAPRTAVRRPAARPSQAPRLAPVPVPAPARPVTRVRADKPEVKAVPTTKLAKVAPVVPATPVKTPPPVTPPAPRPASPPVPKAPADIAPPPPPKLVLEPSKMALPPPKVTLQEPPKVSVPSSPSTFDQPIPVERPRVEIGAPKLEVQSEQPVAPQVAAVQAPSQAPMPVIDTGAPVAPQTQVTAPKIEVPAQTTATIAPAAEVSVSMPARAASQALPAAPVLAPQVHIEPAPAASAPKIDATPPQLASVPDRVAVAAPATVPAPAKAQSVPAPVRVAEVAPPAPAASTSWVQQSDTFGKKPIRQPGHGTADQRQAGQGSPNGVPDYIQRQPQGNTDVMTRHYKGLQYKRTIFDQYWAPDNRDLLSSMLQRLVDALSFHKTFNLGHGVRVHCGGWLLGFGCGGDPPPPPSALSNDPRLNMAPAKPLVPGLGASTAPPPKLPPPGSSEQSVQCETARVSGGPLPPGCRPAKGAQGDWK